MGNGKGYPFPGRKTFWSPTVVFLVLLLKLYRDVFFLMQIKKSIHSCFITYWHLENVIKWDTIINKSAELMVRKTNIAMLLSCYSESTPLDAVKSHVLPLLTKAFFPLLCYSINTVMEQWAELLCSFPSTSSTLSA